MADIDEKREAEIKAALGSDYEDYTAFKTRQDAKALKAKAKELAVAMVSEGGKYANPWAKLNEQLDAIWLKATNEANAEVGVVPEPTVPEEG